MMVQAQTGPVRSLLALEDVPAEGAARGAAVQTGDVFDHILVPKAIDTDPAILARHSLSVTLQGT